MSHPEFATSLEIVGTAGTLLAGHMVLPHIGHRIVETVDGLPRTRTLEGRETYDHQMEAIVEGFSSGAALPTEGPDPIATMELIDAVYLAAGVERPAARPATRS